MSKVRTVKAKMMKGAGTLEETAENMGISEGDMETKRTYPQLVLTKGKVLDGVEKAFQGAINDAKGVFAKMPLSDKITNQDEFRAILTGACDILAKEFDFAKELRSAQTKAMWIVRDIPRLAKVESEASEEEAIEVGC